MEEAGVAKEDTVMKEEEVMDMVEEEVMVMVEEEAKGLEVLVTTSSRSDLTSRTRV